ncbi:Hypothetical predicted protein [Mytilus galloprovincialis]|uniref:EF-hand domain-containing protein n=1 Tax=Mytilus galloprovincialis TaxID=29158 RepID=A0A8B6GEY1_MYTGA|nr:Hypothetical predicted protein [Mytilus galloprovincialis]
MGNRPANRFVNSYEKDAEEVRDRYQVLRDLDVFILDNSIRESTVGQLKGHTLESKWEIYNEVKKCGFKNIIVASFSHMTRVDDIFITELVEKGEDRNGLFAFSEVTDIEKMAQLIKKWLVWIHENLHKQAKVFVNFRDLPEVMPFNSERIFYIIDYLARLPSHLKLFGLLFEEPKGTSLPDEFGLMTKYIRKKMNANNWNGHLLIHVHEKFGFSDYTALEALLNGANGVWASVCLEGAAMGNASSCVTLLNLIRLGNKNLLKRYTCTYLRKAAINITKITTGEDPHSKQPVYGERALDLVLGLDKEEFDLSEFFGEKAPVRISSVASPEMIRTRLVQIFGEDEKFTLELAYKMKEVMLDDLKKSRKEEYMSTVGLAMLFDRAGGAITVTMRDAISKEEIVRPHAQNMIAEIRRRWDDWDLKDKVQGDDMLEYDSFYNGFMAPYFSCYRCSETKKALQAIDMDTDGQVDWDEFLVYIKWAIHEYPDVQNADELLDIAFRKGLIPAMQDELLKN